MLEKLREYAPFGWFRKTKAVAPESLDEGNVERFYRLDRLIPNVPVVCLWAFVGTAVALGC